jgi:replicative DNA helicase
MTTTAAEPLPTWLNIDAERAVLGAILVNPDLFWEVADRLEPADFFRDAHAKIFGVMRELAAEHRAIDQLVLKDRLAQRGLLEQIGGPAYLFGLVEGVPRSTNISAYADIVLERADRRRLNAALERLLTVAEDSTQDTETIIDDAEQTIFALARRRAGSSEFIDAGTIVARGLERLDRLHDGDWTIGAQSGFLDLDDMTRGFAPGTLTLLGGRPAMGKTSFALNVALNAASRGHHVAFFSMEMSEEELFMRLAASEARIDGHRLALGKLSQTEYARLSNALAALAQLGLHVNTSPSPGVLDLRGQVRRLMTRVPLGLVIIDYLQLMKMPKAENRNLEVAKLSRELKTLAREMQLPVVALCQLNREAERRDGKPPMLSDLRDSGALEQDADLVLFVHRPEVFQSDPPPEVRGLAELIIAKHRNGPIGTVRLRWTSESTRFDSLETRRG